MCASLIAPTELINIKTQIYKFDLGVWLETSRLRSTRIRRGDALRTRALFRRCVCGWSSAAKRADLVALAAVSGLHFCAVDIDQHCLDVREKVRSRSPVQHLFALFSICKQLVLCRESFMRWEMVRLAVVVVASPLLVSFHEGLVPRTVIVLWLACGFHLISLIGLCLHQRCLSTSGLRQKLVDIKEKTQ